MNMNETILHNQEYSSPDLELNLKYKNITNTFIFSFCPFHYLIGREDQVKYGTNNK